MGEVDRELDAIAARRRAERFAALGHPRPVALVSARPRPATASPLPPPPPPRARARTEDQRQAKTNGCRARRHAANGQGLCSICAVRPVKPPRQLRGRRKGTKVHRTCQHCNDLVIASRKRREDLP